MNENLLIKNTSLYSNIHDSKSYDIFLASGKIVCIAPAGEITQKGSSIDAKGLIALPGMIDMHIHGAGGADSLEGTTKTFETISQTLAEMGVTGFLSAMVIRSSENNHHLRIANECTGKNLKGAELLGVYIEGPFINMKKRGGIIADCIASPSIGILEKILEQSGDALKIMTVAPEIPGIYQIIKRLREKNIVAAFGHSDADYEETKKGLNMGIKHVTHLFNAMNPLHHRKPGPLGAVFDNPGISVELIADSHHVHPSLIRMVRNIKDSRNITCITDGISGMGLPDGTYIYNNKKYTSKNGLARYLDGTFIGSTMSLGNIAKNFMTFTGAGLKEAIDTVTINPASILGIDSYKGSLEKGKDADIVLIDSSFNIHHTIIAGKPVYQS